MNLKEFIGETVKQIIDGVIEAQKHADSVNAEVSPGTEVQKVTFDVSVTVEENAGVKGNAGLRVWSIGAGIGSKIETASTTAHRIQFGIPIRFPVGKENNSRPPSPEDIRRMST